MVQIICKNWNESLFEKYQAAEELRVQDQFCDVILQSVDKVNVKAHKIILITGSNYFRDLFSSGMKECFEECIKYPQIQGDVLEQVISFIYTGKLEVATLEKIEEIAVCANYFQLHELIKECANVLSAHINDANCLKYWRLAHECFQKSFEEMCISHVLSSSKLLYENETFFIGLDEDEMKILLEDHRLKWSEETKFEKILIWSKEKANNKEEFSSTFSNLLEVINFAAINGNYILKTVIKDDDLVDNKVIRNKIIESLNREGNDEPNEVESMLIPKRSEKKVFALIANELDIISDDGTLCNLQRRVKCVWNLRSAVFNNSMFTCGGRIKLERSSPGSNVCEIFDASKKEWSKLPKMQIPRFWHACEFHEDKIYVCGGLSNGESLTSVEIFDINQSKWIIGPNMSVGRNRFGLSSVNRALYIVGGCNSRNIQMLDSRNPDGWINVHDGFRDDRLTECTSIDTDIYCFRCEQNPYVFDTKMNTLRSCDWNEKYVLPKDRVYFKVAVANDHFHFLAEHLNDFSFIDYYKCDLKGNLIVSKPKIFYMNPRVPIGVLVALEHE